MIKFIKLKNGDVITEAELNQGSEILEEITIKTEDVGFEKHKPYIFIENDVIKAMTGKEVLHPHTEEHHIVWFKLSINNKIVETITLQPTVEPKVEFKAKKLENDQVEVYAYCNLHGVWKGIL
ncbi:MAG: desulfoferrodoxin family protein [Mycoplasma sp.]